MSQVAVICEIPQLYRIFPYSCRGLAEEEKERGRNTYWSPSLNEDQRLLVSWHQNGIFAARLNLTEEAMRILKWKMGDSEGAFRFSGDRGMTGRRIITGAEAR